jgi:hypothetical protein
LARVALGEHSKGEGFVPYLRRKQIQAGKMTAPGALLWGWIYPRSPVLLFMTALK